MGNPHVRGQRYGPPELGVVLFRPDVLPVSFLSPLLCVMPLPLPLVPEVAASDLSVPPLPALPADPLALPFMPALPAAPVAASAPAPVPPLPPPEPLPCAKDASMVPSARHRARAVTTNIFFVSLSKDFQRASQHALSVVVPISIRNLPAQIKPRDLTGRRNRRSRIGFEE